MSEPLLKTDSNELDHSSEQVVAPKITYSRSHLTIETREGYFIFKGREKSDTKRRIVGFSQFFKMARFIWVCVKQNDPYAYKKLLQLDNRMEVVNDYLSELSRIYTDLLQEVDADYLNSISITNPVTVDVSLNTPYSHQAIRLFKLYESVHKQLTIADDTGLILSRKYQEDNNGISKAIKSIVYELLRYKHTGVTFEDMNLNNAKAQSAIEKYGAIDEGIIGGKIKPLHLPRTTYFGTPGAIVDAKENAQG